jgi:hypothetical protein
MALIIVVLLFLILVALLWPDKARYLRTSYHLGFLPATGSRASTRVNRSVATGACRGQRATTELPRRIMVRSSSRHGKRCSIRPSGRQRIRVRAHQPMRGRSPLEGRSAER